MTHIDELREAIRKLHGVEATHRESVPVKETWQGRTVWDGIVEVFDIKGHSKTNTAYGWLHDTGDPANPIQHVTVLHIHPALTPLAAVRAFVMKGIQNASA
jgi:hypothetical protein